MPDQAPASDRSAFAPTRWTLVLRARGDSTESRSALAELCEAYWTPVYRFLRREGRDEDSARELTQGFFAGLLAGARLDGADPKRGPFRSYLLGAVKHFLADRRDHDLRLKRGGGRKAESLEAPQPGSTDTAPALQVPDPYALPPDAYFDREWALAIMDRTLSLLEREFAATGRSSHFAVLKNWLVGDTSLLSQADAASRLGLSEDAVKVVIHRLRRRFRELIRTEVAQTLAEGDDIDAELTYLVEVLSLA